MKILFLAHHKWPHIGGVEKHIEAIKNILSSKDYEINVISEEDIKYPKIKIVGLFYIWWWLFKKRDIIKNADIVHVHDVFIWYLPFRFLYPRKKLYTTFHGWEGVYPIKLWQLLNKKIANKLSKGSISVGKYIEKYYGIKSDHIIYGGVGKLSKNKFVKKKDTIVFLGRQDADTGINEFKEWLKKQKNNFKVRHISNDPNPEKFLKSAQYCVPSGYLSYLEAKNNFCKIITFANNPLKIDYWNEIKIIKYIPTWEDVARVYLKLWK
jgi:hypothetical protein